NLIGLSTGLACVLLIYLWVNDEVSVDKFNEKDDRLYRAMEHRVRANGIWTSRTTSGPLAESLMADMPEVEYATPVTQGQSSLLTIGEKNITADGRCAGKDFFKMFSYPLLEGTPENVLADKNSVVISDILARKLFGTTEGLVGKMIEFQHETSYQVSGVFKGMPVNATEQFEYVLSFEKFQETRDWLKSWGNTGTLTWVLLKPGIDVNAFNAKIADYVKVKSENQITHRTLFLKRYSESYLYDKYENGVLVGGRITYVKMFSIIAVFILVIACINFMNLSTAKASRRIKEVGIKKAIGAGRRALIIQYLGESILMSFLSLLVAILLVDIFLPQFNIITGKNLSLPLNSIMIVLAAGITLLTGLLAGSYPALYLSGFNPAAVLKGKFNIALGEAWARRGLVVFQFTLSIIFIVSVIVIYKQIEFVQSAKLGYEKDNLLYFSLEGQLTDPVKQDALISEIKDIPGVVNASSSSHTLIGHNSGTYGVKWEGKDPEDKTEFENVTVNYDMIETMGVALKEGRTYSRQFGADSATIIFNEKAIEFMGMKDPIGKNVTLWGKDMQIIGVVKNFHYESLHEDVKPVFFRLDPNDTYLLMVRLETGKEPDAMASIEKLYKKFNPGFPLDYTFVDAEYQQQYVGEQRVAKLSRYFAGLAILISCLGLFGLASFTAERRKKEMGIRKILGSSEINIVYLISGDFTRIVFVSIIVALPLSFLAMRYWLSDFVYKISLEWWFFAGAGILALLISWLTVGTQAIRAAKVNPTQCLKEE
ncbi:MAG TPA: ABC transporter permease, partial [Ohtaekwangia sp.]|uniref:ABC transporter permease n=1 Tax=Ohtaekwangia sp. TaxID=2066019 RepID=UPI002F91D370